jgi:hypothetical protein
MKMSNSLENLLLSTYSKPGQHGWPDLAFRFFETAHELTRPRN